MYRLPGLGTWLRTWTKGGSGRFGELKEDLTREGVLIELGVHKIGPKLIRAVVMLLKGLLWTTE